MKDGGPAFPVVVNHIPGVQEGGHEFGMSLRDHFAAALQALIGRMDDSSLRPNAARTAYAFADDMLEARK
jgi:hypothetical protein